MSHQADTSHALGSVKRVGMVVELRPEYLDEYRRTTPTGILHRR